MEPLSLRPFSALIVTAILFVNLIPIVVVAEEPENVAVNPRISARVAVVTGGNKGIGLAIVKGLCKQFDGIVYLTARNVNRGQAAVEELKKVGLHPRFHQLDVTDDSSVQIFKNYLNETHGGIDILVNNAGISYKANATEPFSIEAAETVGVNYFGSLRVLKALLPLLRPHARVVQISSAYGHLSKIPGELLKTRLSNPDLTEEELSQIMRDFVEATRTSTHESLGWPNNSYTVSKVGVTALTRVQQKEFDRDTRADLIVNAIHPGYVDTDLTDHKGIFTPERGAQAALYAALLPQNTEIKGKYLWHDNRVVDWVNEPTPGA